MSTSSQAFSAANPIPPRVVGINHGIFETPENSTDPVTFTVPTNYNLFIAKSVAPSNSLGFAGDWYIRNTTDSSIIYQKNSTWAPYTTITGAASADLTAVYADIATLTTGLSSANSLISTETTNRENADIALATSISTVSANASTKNRTFIQGTTPTATATGDLWIDTASGYKLKRWDGAAWVDTTVADGAIGAAVSVESSARATADGHLEGKYTLSVVAGNVITGMNITSSTGGGTDISSVIFRASEFYIEDGASGTTPFSVVAGVVYMSDAVVSGELDIGTGYQRVHITSTGLSVGGIFTVGSPIVSTVTASWDSGALGNGKINIFAQNGVGASIMLIDTAGVTMGTISALGTASLVSTTLGNGTAASPALNFTADTNTGWFSNGADDMAASAGGTIRMHVKAATIEIDVPLTFDTTQQAIGAETLQKYITAKDSSGATIKLAIVA